MDPNSEQYNRAICLADAIAVMDDWLTRGHTFYWSRKPSDIQIELFKEAVNQPLKLGKAIEILRTAHTEKMHGQANKGLSFIEQEWKKL